MKSNSRCRRDTSQERGRMAEDKFFEAIKALMHTNKPEWFLRARRPTLREDRWEGKDAIIETTDAGELFVQIKSSLKGADCFRRGMHFRRNNHIGIIIIHGEDTLPCVFERVMELIHQVRQNVLENQAVSNF